MYKKIVNKFFSDLDSKSVKLIGRSDDNEYCKLIKSIYDKAKSIDCIFWNDRFLTKIDTATISYIRNEVVKMNLRNLYNEEIVLSSNDIYNVSLKNSLIESWNYANQSELFLNSPYTNEAVRQNVLASLISTIYNVLLSLNLSVKNPRIIYYGAISNHDALVLRTLSRAGIKVMYINSIEDNTILDFELIKLGENKQLLAIDDVLKIGEEQLRVDTEVTETVGKKYSEEVGALLFDGINTFKPRQLFGLYNKRVHLDCILEDIKNYWNEENRFRNSFKVENNVVYTPSFLIKINGIYDDIFKYKELVDVTKSKKSKDISIFLDLASLVPEKVISHEGYSLVYYMNNFMLDKEKIKTHKLYKLGSLSNQVQERLLTKIADFISFYGLNKKIYTIEDFILLVYNLISANSSILKLLENFDYPFKVPKLVLYDNRDYDCSKIDVIFIDFLSTLGIDIIIFSPRGNCFIENTINTNINVFSLDKIDENFNINELDYIKEKKNIFKRFFNS